MDNLDMVKSVKRMENVWKVETNVEDYFVLVFPNAKEKGYLDFWLMKEGYGIASFMFGVNISEDEIEDFVERNVYSYIEGFREEYGWDLI